MASTQKLEQYQKYARFWKAGDRSCHLTLCRHLKGKLSIFLGVAFEFVDFVFKFNVGDFKGYDCGR